jgi:shikimate kinase
MTQPKKIFLIGPMGAGKSAVGRHIARKLHLNFVDSDDEIESRTGVDIAFIFEKEGEEGFRKRESAVIDELTSLDDVVLATGGGAVGHPDNRKHMGGRGFVVYLYTSVDQQVARTEKSRSRPLLEEGNRRQILADLLQARDPLYREIADLVVETDGRRVHSVASEIVESIS